MNFDHSILEREINKSRLMFNEACYNNYKIIDDIKMLRANLDKVLVKTSHDMQLKNTKQKATSTQFFLGNFDASTVENESYRESVSRA